MVKIQASLGPGPDDDHAGVSQSEGPIPRNWFPFWRSLCEAVQFGRGSQKLARPCKPKRVFREQCHAFRVIFSPDS